MIDALPLLLGPEGYQISRSVRLRSSASASFSRTPGSATNRQTWTWSGWIKRGTLSGSPAIFGAFLTNNTTETGLRFDSNTINFYSYTSSYLINASTPAVFRDPSAWYHVVLAVDTTQATNSNGVKLWVNGVQQTLTFSAYTQNHSTYINNNNQHYLGRDFSGGYQDGYLTEINFIDGQALTPASFGSTNATTGVWQPIKYTGTYGTNGFYLNFSDNSAATAAAIGKDNSGNGNNWTPTNISVTAGVTYDSMLDVPTQWADGGNGRGNYSTLNPLAMYGTNAVISNASLTSTATGSANDRGWPSTIAAPGSGKWYAEFTFTATDAGNNGGCGIMLENGTGAPGESATTVSWRDAGTLRQNASGTSYGTALSAGDIVMLAYDASLGRVWFGKNGTWFASGDPATNANPSATGITTTGRIASYHYGVAATIHANFGQRPFAFSPPTGFKALNTLNLPTPTILKGNQYFDATTYTGNGGALTVTNSGSMQPDLLWTKARSSTAFHYLQDAVRGVNKALFSNATDAEYSISPTTTTLNSNGFSFNGGESGLNANTQTYIAWQWKEGATQGFDIVTYTGTGANQSIAHNLGVIPSMLIVKRRNSTGDWPVQHRSVSASNVLWLNLTNAQTTSTTFQQTYPTSSVFYIDGGNTNVGANGSTYVAYLFAAVAGYSAFGSYTGNGSADGPMIFTGFLPRWLMWKRSDSTGSWFIYDSARGTTNVMGPELYAESSAAEATATRIDFLSNGFKLRAANAGDNANGATYVYACFASNPFKNSLAR